MARTGSCRNPSRWEPQATNTYVFQGGELASRTTPLGLTVSFTHDLLGRLTSVGFPDGTTVSNVFDRLDRVAWKDRLGHWSYACYDRFGQLRDPDRPQRRDHLLFVLRLRRHWRA